MIYELIIYIKALIIIYGHVLGIKVTKSAVIKMSQGYMRISSINRWMLLYLSLLFIPLVGPYEIGDGYVTFQCQVYEENWTFV